MAIRYSSVDRVLDTWTTMSGISHAVRKLLAYTFVVPPGAIGVEPIDDHHALLMMDGTGHTFTVELRLAHRDEVRFYVYLAREEWDIRAHLPYYPCLLSVLTQWCNRCNARLRTWHLAHGTRRPAVATE